jgi:hypothetical protein
VVLGLTLHPRAHAGLAVIAEMALPAQAVARAVLQIVMLPIFAFVCTRLHEL